MSNKKVEIYSPNGDLVLPKTSTTNVLVDNLGVGGLGSGNLPVFPNLDETLTNMMETLNSKVDDAQVLTNVPVGAVFTDTVYTHPANHPPSIITQDVSNRFVTDIEKTTWNGKEPAITGGTSTQYLRGDKSLATFATDVLAVAPAETAATIKATLGITTLSGTNTGDQTTITGNAGSATTLQTARTINGVGFNGSANITINAVDSTPRVASSLLGVANGVATLDASGFIPTAQLPSYVDDVLEFANLASFPATGVTGKIYLALDTNKPYRWSGTVYVYITSGAVDSVAGKTGVVTLVKGDVGLGSVDNTSDLSKPISTATQTALNGKVDDSQVLTNVPAGAVFTDTIYTLPASVVHDTEAGALHATDALRISGTSLYLYRGDGTFETVTTQDTNTIYSHPTGDGNLHVIATSTTNNGKVLTAGATAGALSWTTPAVGTVTSIIAGTGLSGGTITTSGTISVNYGTTSTTACVGNDSRLSDARSASDVYAWAKASAKPSYGYLEVGAPSTTGTNATGTWPIHITGNANYATTAGSAPANGGTSAAVTIGYNDNSNSTYQMLWGSGNNVKGTAGIYCNPYTDMLYAASFNATSLRALKENIAPFELSAVDIINSTDIVEFNYIADESKTTHIGFIADDTHEALSGKDHDRFDLNNTVAVLLKAVQELNSKIIKLEKGDK